MEVSPERFEAWLARNLPGEPSIGRERLDGGATNQAWRIRRAGASDLVLRVMRRGLPALRRELEARVRVEGRVPVPESLAVGFGSEELGWPWVLDGFVPGDRLDLRLSTAEAGAAARLGEVVGATVAKMAVAAGEPGAREGFLRRTSLEACLGRWLGEDRPRSRLGEARLDEVRGLMVELAPRSRSRGMDVLVHGDLKPANVLVAGPEGEPQVVGVLDWEWASWGDPMADLARILREVPGAAAGVLADPEADRGFGPAVVRGYRQAGGRLPARWQERLTLWEMALWIEAVKAEPVPPGIVAAACARIDELVGYPGGSG